MWQQHLRQASPMRQKRPGQRARPRQRAQARPGVLLHLAAPPETRTSQPPPERPQAAEGTQSAAALWAVNCSDLLGDCITLDSPPFG